MEEGVEAEPWVPRFMVAVLCQDPPSRSHLQDGSCSQLPLSWRSWGWGINRDEHALGWTRAREVLRTEGPIPPMGPVASRTLSLPWRHVPPSPHSPFCLLIHSQISIEPSSVPGTLPVPGGSLFSTLERAWSRLAQPPPPPRLPHWPGLRTSSRASAVCGFASFHPQHLCLFWHLVSMSP